MATSCEALPFGQWLMGQTWPTLKATTGYRSWVGGGAGQNPSEMMAVSGVGDTSNAAQHSHCRATEAAAPHARASSGGEHWSVSKVGGVFGHFPLSFCLETNLMSIILHKNDMEYIHMHTVYSYCIDTHIIHSLKQIQIVELKTYVFWMGKKKMSTMGVVDWTP